MSNTNSAPEPQKTEPTQSVPPSQPILDPAHPQFWEYHGQLANRG